MSQTSTILARVATPFRWKGVLWLLHIFAVALAVGSVVTNQFEVWIDLRLLAWGGIGVGLKILWAGATVLVPWCAGPRIGGWMPGAGRKAQWRAGFSAATVRWLLWPTYGVLGCLLANTLNYFRLWYLGRADRMVPLPLVVGMLLATWVLLTRDYLRRENKGQERLTLGRQWGAGAVAGLIWVFVLGFLLVHVYYRAPKGPVDLAVVLGGRLNFDGTASNELTERVHVATELYHRGLVKHILLSGAVDLPPASWHQPEHNETAAMRQVCLDAGVPEEALTLDPVGLNTKATAFNTRLFMQERGYKSVVGCSSDYHLIRTQMSLDQEGLEAYTLPGVAVDWICADPWPTLREMVGIPVYVLFPHYREAKGKTMQLKNPKVLVRKSAGTLELFDGEVAVKTYPCITGGLPGDKVQEGDRKTPVGIFRIVYKNPRSKFHLSLGLDYPNRDAAQRGLASGLITQAEYEGILEALESDLTKEKNQKKLWYTKLGGEIFIHGYGEGRTGTAGCIALKNSDVDELYAILPVGTGVEIRP